MPNTTRCAKCTTDDAQGLALEAELRGLPNGEGDEIITQMQNLPRTFDCTNCGTHLEIWDRGNDTTCNRCRTPFNCFGQELRRDWASNPAWHNGEIDDLEGFEHSQLAAEGICG